MKLRLIVLAGVSLVTACASGPTKEEKVRLDALIGQTQVDVVRAWGVPSRTYEANGHLFMAYVDNETGSSAGSMNFGMGGWGGNGWGAPGWGGNGWGWGGGGWGWGGNGWGYGGMPASYYSSSCQTTFELVKGTVTGWTVRGNGC
ncbi:MAG: hypothetical protein SOH81_03365 [Acetobacter sp.]